MPLNKSKLPLSEAEREYLRGRQETLRALRAQIDEALGDAEEQPFSLPPTLSEDDVRLLLRADSSIGRVRLRYDDVAKFRDLVMRLAGIEHLPRCSECGGTLLEDEYKGAGVAVKCEDCEIGV